MKGFTLVELLAVLVILALISLIIVPSIIDSLNNSADRLYKEQIDSLEYAAQKWAVKNSNLVEENKEFSRCVTIDELKEGEFITEKKVINPKTRKEMTGCVNITYDEEYNQFVYKYKEE